MVYGNLFLAACLFSNFALSVVTVCLSENSYKAFDSTVVSRCLVEIMNTVRLCYGLSV